MTPPRWLVGATFVGLAALLYYPIHVPYQNPDQDYPGIALLEMVRGGWEPWTIYYPSALTNLLRAGYELVLLGARAVGRHVDAIDLCAAFARDPAAFRIAPRLVAMTAGVVSLVAVARLAVGVTDAWSGLFAAVLLGTSYMFVREHHHGMFDAPASAAVIVALACCARYVRSPGRGMLAAAMAAAAVAMSFKWNAAVALACPLVALVLAPAPPGGRFTALGVALLAGVLAMLVTSPVVVLEPRRVGEQLYWAWDYFAHLARQVARQGGPAYGFGSVMRNGLGIPLAAVALVGAATAVARRERALVPLLFFTAVYGWIVWRSPLVFNRYALPLAPPLAVLAAYALHRWTPFGVRVVAVAALVAIALPTCLAYDSLLAREDTRVASARWLREHVRPEAAIFLPGTLMTAMYVGPDLSRPLVGLPADRADELARRTGPPFPRVRRYHDPNAASGRTASGPARLAPWANGIVVTSETYDGPFRRESTPFRAVTDLEAYAYLLGDFPVERMRDFRTYEPDLNYVPMTGLSTLLRPGPHIRIWYVPALDQKVESPFIDGRVPVAARF